MDHPGDEKEPARKPALRSGAFRLFAFCFLSSIFLFSLFSLSLTGCLAESKRHFDRGRILFERRDLKGARAELIQAIKADPDMLEAHKLLARVDEYLGDQQDAALEYETAARLDPADPRLRNKARFYRQLGRAPEHPGATGPTPAPASR